jgi:hypothetical protein
VKEHHRFEVLDAIFEARVPILRMRFDGALEVGMEASVVESLGEGSANSPRVRSFETLNTSWAEARKRAAS